ncbi:Cobalt-zinc-cadmium resistance protein CzcD [hydrothermal vent metagenome]|uniref:Cobalt-zinc-cadmium resistance protein CzcD n=1 Tax=hydrothermal vent metagenome TaxID=652676 RepID=A0A3B1AKB7_9ZZZZ
MPGCGCEIEIKDREQSRVLVILLAINGVMFVVEMIAGIIGDSTALIADSLDMLADATVYGIGLYAVGRSLLVKAKAAHISGIFQIMLGLGVLFDIVRRFIVGSEPEPMMMMAVGAVALIANSICLMLIYKHRQGEVHMRASWIFSKNDVIANLGVICGGLLVAWLGSPWPDLVIGLAIAMLVVRGGVHIIKDARSEKKLRLRLLKID